MVRAILVMGRLVSLFSLYESEYPVSLPWFLGFILVLLTSKLFTAYRRSRVLPPGPRGLPFLGNIFQIPTQLSYIKFTEWAEEFGPMFSLNVGGHTLIVLNTFKVASDLLERRSELYSDRPRLIMAGEILTDGCHIAFSRYDNKWRKMRRAVQEGFSLRTSKKYEYALSREATFATLQLLKDPEPWADHINRLTARAILTAVYGWPSFSDRAELFIEGIHKHVQKLTESAAPCAHLVELIPALKHIPTWMAKWKREGLEWHKQQTETFQSFVKEVEDEKLLRDTPECFVSDLIANRDRHQLTDKEAAWLAGIEFSAGAGTTSTTLLYFIQAMVFCPEVMRKAQAELDVVVGRERAPTFKDQTNLPYIGAIVKEVLRWRPVGPMAVPRRVTEDDWYEGYLIPKGSTIIANLWAMNRDPKVFPDFDDFRPERFLEELSKDTHYLGHATFSFGKRMCPGYNFANQTLFISIATFLWAMRIDKARDLDGKLIVPSRHDFVDSGLAVAPAPFKCATTPRFDEALSILRSNLPEEMKFV